MKKIGMIGGIGPESTVDYYQRLIELYQQRTGKEDYPEIILNSINMTAMLKMVSNKDWDRLIYLLTDAVGALDRAGADFAFMASNTPHIVFEQIKHISPVPLVSIVEATRKEAENLNVKKVGLLGTLFTMQSRYYQEALHKSGIAVEVPNQKEQEYIQQKLFSEIEQGIFLDATKEGLLNIIDRMIHESEIDGLILGCTELPLILTKDEFGIPFLNTTKIHVDRIIDYYLQ